MPLLLGIDTGGTYTDAVLFDDDTGVVATAKSLTTRHDLSLGIGRSIDAVVAQSGIAPAEIALVSLSTTLATNALVEGQGGRVCLVLVGFAASALSKYGLAATMKDSPVIVLDGWPWASWPAAVPARYWFPQSQAQRTRGPGLGLRGGRPLRGAQPGA